VEQPLPEYCVIVPSAHKGQFTLYQLAPSASISGLTYVIIPYTHPEKEDIQPRYFSVITKSDLTISLEQSAPIQMRPATSRQAYLDNVEKLKTHIQIGNIYEINYCMEFFGDNVTLEPLSLFAKLCELARVPYPAMLKIKDDYVICASPELFLKKEGDILITKPIKGTARRDADPNLDEQLKQELFHSLKERTENVMAVDVARNDLSQVAQKGSVEVNKLYNIESYETVHQMVSTVRCTLKPDCGFNEIIQTTFPMASMTGAPKISAMNLIDEYEDFKRGFYSGTMGFINEEGDFTLPVIIRSIFYNSATRRVSFAVGGAITYLSEPEKEYEECLLKARNILKALNAEIM
jgi:para-aminobenzoate synthetase component I